MVRYDVTVARIPVISIGMPAIFAARVPPIRMFQVPLADVRDEFRNPAITRNHRQTRIDQMIDVGGDECLRFHRGPEHGCMDGVPVVADTGGFAGKSCGKSRLARCDHRPRIDEDLRSDLFGDRCPVGFDRTAERCNDASIEIEPGRVFGRNAVPSPPEDGPFLDDVILPGPADGCRCEVIRPLAILECSDEGERTRDVVVGHDKRVTEAVMNKVCDLTEFAQDPFIGPPFERAPEVDPDQLAEDAGVDAFDVVLRESHGPFRFTPWPVLQRLFPAAIPHGVVVANSDHFRSWKGVGRRAAGVFGNCWLYQAKSSSAMSGIPARGSTLTRSSSRYRSGPG